MNTKTIGVLVGVLAFLAVGFFVGKVFSPSTPPLGNSSSPSVIGGCMDVNGVTTCFARQTLVLASTTPCAIKSPAATSSIDRLSLMITTATSTATTWTLATSTTAFATSTRLGSYTLASGFQGVLRYTASSSASTIGEIVDGVDVLAPNTYIVWGAQGFVPAGAFLKGVCSASFQII